MNIGIADFSDCLKAAVDDEINCRCQWSTVASAKVNNANSNPSNIVAAGDQLAHACRSSQTSSSVKRSVTSAIPELRRLEEERLGV